MPSTDELVELVNRKHGCLVQLCELARRQCELADSGDMSRLLKVLSAKQHLIELLRGIEQDLTPFRNDDPNQRAWPTPADRQKCADMAQACHALMVQLVEQEKASEACLLERRDEARRRLDVAHTAQHARHAYIGPDVTQSSGLDLSSER